MKAGRGDNGRFPPGSSILFEGRRETMEALDSLPPELREAIYYARDKWSPMSAIRLMAKGVPVNEIIAGIRRAEKASENYTLRDTTTKSRRL